MRRNPTRSLGRTFATLGLLTALGVASSSHAQVLEIVQGGALITHAGPATYDGDAPQGRSLLHAPAVAARPQAAAPADIKLAIAAAAARHGVSERLVTAVAWQESRLNQAAVSPKGARGVMQLMPGTAADLGADAHDLQSNVQGGTAYLAQMLRRFDGDVPKALAAYNAGPGAVTRYGGTPPYGETLAYVDNIMARLADDAGPEGAQ